MASPNKDRALEIKILFPTPAETTQMCECRSSISRRAAVEQNLSGFEPPSLAQRRRLAWLIWRKRPGGRVSRLYYHLRRADDGGSSEQLDRDDRRLSERQLADDGRDPDGAGYRPAMSDPLFDL